MQEFLSWVSVVITSTLLVVYEIHMTVKQRQKPLHTASTTHARLREEWLLAVSQQKGSEILAVQTLRNSVMSATVIASTAALALIGFATITMPSLRQTWISPFSFFTPSLLLELTMSILLMASLITSVMAVRFYNHLSFIVGMPVGSNVRDVWLEKGKGYAKRAGLLYSASLRYFTMVIPVLSAILWIPLGPLTALVLLLALLRLDRV